MATGREGELVDAAFADGPFIDGITTRLGFAGVDGVAFALLEQLVGGDCVGTEDVVVVDVEVTAGLCGQEAVWGARDPLDASYTRLVNVSLQ